MKSIVWVLFGILLAVNASLAQSIDEQCTQNGSSACIDWNRGIVIAEGLGAPSSKANNPALRNASALRAARLDAARNILEMIKGVNLSSSTTMKDAMVENDVILTQIQGRIHGLRPIGAPKYFSDGTIKVRMEARLHETVPQELVFQNQPSAGPVVLAPVAPASGTEARDASTIDANRVYTGLVIDARKTGLQPAMSPKVFDEQGKELYGSAYVEREFVVKHGMAGYVKVLEQAQQNDRVKPSPLVIQALQSTGANQTDLVVNSEIAAKVRQIAAHQNFLREARVVIVLD